MSNPLKSKSPVRHPYFKISKRFVKLDNVAWHKNLLESEKIKQITTGKGGKVAIIDSGVDHLHPELFGKVIFKSDRTSEGLQAGEHGTFVAGEMAGTTVGLFPELEIGDFKALTAMEGLGDSKWVIHCIEDATREGFEVINASIGSDYPDYWLEQSVRKYCANPKHFFVAAAGNDGKGTETESTTDYPGNWAGKIKGVISVGAVGLNKNGTVYVPTWSSRGNVVIVAPGAEILGILPDEQYGIMSGTSMATPLVAAIIAACKVFQPEMDQDYFMEALQATSVDIEGAGYDRSTGYGLVNAINLLEYCKSNKVQVKQVQEEKVSFFDKWKYYLLHLWYRFTA